MRVRAIGPLLGFLKQTQGKTDLVTREGWLVCDLGGGLEEGVARWPLRKGDPALCSLP